jgi:hypothetical protein
MQDIELRIPVELTTARIQRANPSLAEHAVYELAVELHKSVGFVLKLYSVRPTCESYAESEETDLVDTILRTAVDMWPRDKDTAARESIWVAECFMAVDGDELYERYLLLCDKINGTDIAKFLDER